MANNPTLLKAILAADGDKNTIPQTTDATTGLFSEQYGWQSINELPLTAGGKAPQRKDFNGAFNLLGGVAFFAQKGWTFKFDSGQAYYAGCVVRDTTDNKQYECIADVAAGGSVPSADTTHWKEYKLGTDIDGWFRQPSTIYQFGDIRYLTTLPPGWYLECYVGGESSSGGLTISTPTAGSTVTDGAVTWTVCKLASGDGIAVGIILPFAGNGAIPSGYLLCDGAAYSRTAFPDLFAAIGTDYGSGDGSTTFNVPDVNQAQRFLQGDTVAGQTKSAGLPNITGSLSSVPNTANNASAAQSWDSLTTGALKASIFNTKSTVDINGGSAADSIGTIGFDASRSSSIYGNSTTVQPDALTTRYIIKAFDGQTADSALIDITQFENELGGKADRSLSNLTTTGLEKLIKSVSKAQNGYLTLENGLIIQWGKYAGTVRNNGTTDVGTFPISFPNKCCAVFMDNIWLFDVSSISIYGAGVRDLSTFSFAYVNSAHAGQTYECFILAIGY